MERGKGKHEEAKVREAGEEEEEEEGPEASWMWFQGKEPCRTPPFSCMSKCP